MKFIAFVYYKLYKLNSYAKNEVTIKLYTWIETAIFILIHWLTIAGLSDTFLHTDLMNESRWLIVVGTIPYLLVAINRKAFYEEVDKLIMASPGILKRKNLFFWIYVVMSGALLIISLSSPAWVKHFRQLKLWE